MNKNKYITAICTLCALCLLISPVMAMTQVTQVESDEYNYSYYATHHPVESNIFRDIFRDWISSLSSINLLSIVATTSCGNLGFTETVKCEDEIIGTSQYTIAWGWTTSSGQSGHYIYRPPVPWEYDHRYVDQEGSLGSHGGCPKCIMTLVHLRIHVKTLTCGDGTVYNNCSINQKSFYCLEGNLIQKASQCGCPSGQILYGDTCITPKCYDNTPYNTCSITKPLYCYYGSLINKASQCGCPSGQTLSGDICIGTLTPIVTTQPPIQTTPPTSPCLTGYVYDSSSGECVKIQTSTEFDSTLAIITVVGLVIVVYMVLRGKK